MKKQDEIKQTVVIGLLGSTLDMGKRGSRWKRWRPTVGLCQQDDLLISRFELLYQKKFSNLLQRVIADIETVSPETWVVTHPIALDNPWDFEEVYGVLHDFATEYAFDPDQNDYLVHITTGTHVTQICLFLLTESRYFPARLVQTGPARTGTENDPAGVYTIIDLDLSKYDRIAMRFQKEQNNDISFLKSGIETRSQNFNALIERIERVAINSVDPILMTGPTGAGKSHLARRIYELKKSRHQFDGAFAEVNCATLRGDAAMSALFGHKKGAFTGATGDRQGMLRAADKGMLFLDEVGELGLDEQSMLLRAIEEKRFLPMGSDHEVSSDFQLICGTNQDLSLEAVHGKFRADLLSRINLWTFEMPGLKDRTEDIEPNLDFELDKFARRSGTQVTFNQEARKRFLDFSVSGEAIWAANFRDLNGAVTRMATLAHSGRITLRDVEEEISQLRKAWYPEVNRKKNQDELMLKQVLGNEQASMLDRFDKVQLADVLKVIRETKTLSGAGRKLFAISRQSKKITNDADRLRKYLAKFGLKWKEISQILF